MTIACLGWGSLIWDPQGLPTCGDWLEDGPALPLEFARESEDGRMTLVIVDHPAPVPTLWTQLNVRNLEEAIRALHERERTQWTGSIGRWPLGNRPHRFSQDIGTWAQKKGLEGVVWTDLKAGFRPDRKSVPTLEEITRHIGGLPTGSREKAAEYVLRAPSQIVTPFRPQLEELLS